MRKFPPLEGKCESTTMEMCLCFEQEALFLQLYPTSGHNSSQTRTVLVRKFWKNTIIGFKKGPFTDSLWKKPPPVGCKLTNSWLFSHALSNASFRIAVQESHTFITQATCHRCLGRYFWIFERTEAEQSSPCCTAPHTACTPHENCLHCKLWLSIEIL